MPIEVVCPMYLRASYWVFRRWIIGRDLILRPIIERSAETERDEKGGCPPANTDSHTQMPCYLRPHSYWLYFCGESRPTLWGQMLWILYEVQFSYWWKVLRRVSFLNKKKPTSPRVDLCCLIIKQSNECGTPFRLTTSIPSPLHITQREGRWR